MAANDNVVVRIVGDASGVQPAVEQTDVSLSALGPIVSELNASIQALTAKMTEGFAAGAESAKQLAGGLEETSAAAEHASASVGRMSERIHMGGLSFGFMEKAVGPLMEAMIALFAFDEIKRWAEELGEAAEKVEHLAAETGMSVGQIQALSGAATLSGTNIDMLTKGLAMMANRSVTVTSATTSSAKALHAMGISANDGTTNMQRLMTIADKFHSMADGPQKAALAMQLFGRSGREMIPFLNQGSAAIEQLMDKSKEYGAVNEHAVEVGAQLAASVNESKVAWEGLKNTLTEAFGPILVQMADGFNAMVRSMHDSYEAGGAVKVIFDALADIFDGMRADLQAVGEAFSEIFTDSAGNAVSWSEGIRVAVEVVVLAFKLAAATVVMLVDAFKAAFHIIAAGLESFIADFTEWVGGVIIKAEVLGDFMKTVGKVCEDALTLHWGQIASDWDAGMAQVQGVVKQRADQILSITGQMRKQAQEDMAAAAGIQNSFGGFINGLDMNNPLGGAPAHSGIKPNFGGGFGDVPDIASSGKGKKGGGAKDDLVQKLQEELQAKKDAWNEEQLAQDTAQQFSIQSEADFWQQALQRTDLSAKDRLAIEQKYLTAAQAVQKEAEDEKLAQMKREIDAAGQNLALKLSLLRQEQAEIHRFYGDKSKEALAADEEVAKAEQQLHQEQMKMTQELKQAQQDAALWQVDQAEKAAELEEQLGQISKGQLLAQQRKFEDQRYQIQLNAMQERLALLRADPTQSPEAVQKAQLEIEALERQHQAKLNDIDRQAILQRTQLERQAEQQVSQGWADNISKLITLQQSFITTYKGLLQTLQQAVGSYLAGELQQTIHQQLSKLLHIQLTNTEQVASENATNAAILTSRTALNTTSIALQKTLASSGVSAAAAMAGAGGVASMAAAPWPLDMGAPAFGASMAAAAMAYSTLNSAAGGDWNVSEGLYHLHHREMVLPAWAAQPLREMISSGGAPGHSTTNSQSNVGGDIHLHYSPTINERDRVGLKQMLASDSGAMIDFLNRQVRDGKLKLQPA